MPSLYPKLSEHLQVKVERHYKFECSLDPSEVSVIWNKLPLQEKVYHYAYNNIFTIYSSFKNERNKGNKRKPLIVTTG